MKTLIDFCKANNLHLIPITYKCQGIRLKRKGFDIVSQAGFVLVSFEPAFYSEKWYLRYVHSNFQGKRYINRITRKVLSQIDINEHSFIINSVIADKAGAKFI